MLGPELPKRPDKDLCDIILFDIAERGQAPPVGTKEMAARGLPAGPSGVPQEGFLRADVHVTTAFL